MKFTLYMAILYLMLKLKKGNLFMNSLESDNGLYWYDPSGALDSLYPSDLSYTLSSVLIYPKDRKYTIKNKAAGVSKENLLYLDHFHGRVLCKTIEKGALAFSITRL